MPSDSYLPEMPEELSARLREISLRTGMSDEEIMCYLLHTFLEMAKNPRGESDDVLMARIRAEVRQKLQMEES